MVTADLALCHPALRWRILALLEDAQQAGLQVRAFETFRSAERQQHLFDEQKTEALPGESYHNPALVGQSLACDLVFTGPQPWGAQHPWPQLGQLALNLGLIWGGEWTIQDLPHVEYHPGLGPREATRVTPAYLEALAEADGTPPQLTVGVEMPGGQTDKYVLGRWATARLGAWVETRRAGQVWVRPASRVEQEIQIIAHLRSKEVL